MKWISVKDRLPKIEEIVLAYAPQWCSDESIVLTYDGEWYDYNGVLVDSVTHWMPLPEPPSN